MASLTDTSNKDESASAMEMRWVEVKTTWGALLLVETPTPAQCWRLAIAGMPCPHS